MLEQAGVSLAVDPADIDETGEKQGGTDDVSIALALAKAKALAVSGRRPGDWVIGGDSVVSVGGRRFDKPRDREEAAQHLRTFAGKAMQLTSAAALARDGTVEWSITDSAVLQVRDLSQSFIDDYLDLEWPDVGYCVGVFRLEGRGVQLFDSIDGSFFTVLGMPLLPLLSALRDHGIVPR